MTIDDDTSKILIFKQRVRGDRVDEGAVDISQYLDKK